MKIKCFILNLKWQVDEEGREEPKIWLDFNFNKGLCLLLQMQFLFVFCCLCPNWWISFYFLSQRHNRKWENLSTLWRNTLLSPPQMLQSYCTISFRSTNHYFVQGPSWLDRWGLSSYYNIFRQSQVDCTEIVWSDCIVYSDPSPLGTGTGMPIGRFPIYL